MHSCRPIVRWAGSKRKLVPALLRLAPLKFDTYYEPFVGSACLFVALAPKKAVLGDINSQLISTYRTLKKQVIEVVEMLQMFPQSSDFYYELRAVDPADLTATEQAARFIYLNRFCFNGVYRTNKDGKFNVPIGSHTGRIPSSEEFQTFAGRLAGAKLLTCDFSESIRGAKKDDFIYADPPYASKVRLSHGEYGYGSFNESDIGRLISSLHTASKKGVKILLSYASSKEIRAELKSWKTRHVRVRRNVAGFAKQRRVVTEMMLTNFT